MKNDALTIVICTCNRVDNLVSTLSRLSSQCSIDDEILVVDNRPLDDKALLTAKKFGVNYLRVISGGKSTAMNVGVKNSKNEIVAFLDDDDFVEDGWRSKIIYHFEDPAIAYVSGLRKPYELKTVAQKLFHLKGGFDKGIGFRKFNWVDYKKTWWRGVPVYLMGLGGNSAVRKSSLIQINGFDETFGPGELIWASESTEMCYRLLKSGHTLLYDPELVVLNKYIEDYKDLKHRLYHYGVGDMAIQAKFLITYGDFRSLSEILFYRSFRQFKRITVSLLKNSKFPVSLILLEWGGNLLGPWIYILIKTTVWFNGLFQRD